MTLDGDIADKMIAAWNNPFATADDPRRLLVHGAKEIRALRRELAASQCVVATLHQINEEMAEELRARRPDPNAPLYLAGVLLIAVCLFAGWMLVW